MESRSSSMSFVKLLVHSASTRVGLFSVCCLVAFFSARYSILQMTHETFIMVETPFMELVPAPSGVAQSTTMSKHKVSLETEQEVDVFWCEGSREGSMPEGRLFHHFPHAMEFVARCWSWFMTQQAYPGRCGIVLDQFAKKRLLWNANTDWVVKVLEVTGCELRFEEPDHHNSTNNVYVPDLHEQNPLLKHTWVDKPQHAWELRDVLMKHSGIALRPRDNTTAIRIGFVDRLDTRRVTNMMEIVQQVSKLFDNVVLDMTWFTSATPMEEQVAWFASHDLIIGAHGAAMTNCLFLQPNTVVVEIFPKKYFPVDFFGSLIEQVGGVHMPLYADHHLSGRTIDALEVNRQAGIQAHMNASRIVSERQHWRHLDIDVKVDDVIYLVELGMKHLLGSWPQHLDGTSSKEAMGKKRAQQNVQIKRHAYFDRIVRLVNMTLDRET